MVGAGVKGVSALTKEGSQTLGGATTATTVTVSIATGSAGVAKVWPATLHCAETLSARPAGPVSASERATLPFASLAPVGPEAPAMALGMLRPLAAGAVRVRLHESADAGRGTEPAAALQFVAGSGTNLTNEARRGAGVL